MSKTVISKPKVIKKEFRPYTMSLYLVHFDIYCPQFYLNSLILNDVGSQHMHFE